MAGRRKARWKRLRGLPIRQANCDVLPAVNRRRLGDGFENRNPADGEILVIRMQLGETDADAAFAAMPRYLCALAGFCGSTRFFAVLETPATADGAARPAVTACHWRSGMSIFMPDWPAFWCEMPGRQAMGVCAQVARCNFPLLMLEWKTAPALAAGDGVVLKAAG